MAKFNGTPGPWSIGNVDTTCKVTSEDGLICEIGFGWDEDADSRALADTRLIAAAPDLLKALSGIMNHHASNVLFHNKPMAEMAWAAIEKAVGDQI